MTSFNYLKQKQKNFMVVNFFLKRRYNYTFITNGDIKMFQEVLRLENHNVSWRGKTIFHNETKLQQPINFNKLGHKFKHTQKITLINIFGRF
jgi:hypothetical protein